MADNYIHLIGSEAVQRAANQISSAASDMAGAANTFGYVCEKLMRTMDSQLDRLECLVERMEKAKTNHETE